MKTVGETSVYQRRTFSCTCRFRREVPMGDPELASFSRPSDGHGEDGGETGRGFDWHWHRR